MIPFGEFVKKHDLSPMIWLVNTLGQGLGNILAQPTLYVMKNFGKTALKGFASGFLVTANGNNSEIYEKALVELNKDAFLGSSVLATQRTSEVVRVLVQTPAGQKVIEAKKLLVTIPPKLELLQGFDLDPVEKSLFSQFENSAYYTFLLRNSGIPDNHYIINARPDTTENLPELPGVYQITPTGIQNLVNLKYGSPTKLSKVMIARDVFESLKRLAAAQTIQSPTASVALFASHTPFELTVPVPAIRNGFYKKINTINGHLSTFYTGAAFQAHDASLLWEYTETVLKKMEASK